MERKELKKAIVEVVGRAGGCMTALSIAKELGYKKSPHFVGVLSEMCDEGFGGTRPLLVCAWAKHLNKQDARFFSLPSQAIMLPGMEIYHE